MNKPLILVVEDDGSVRNLITTTLQSSDYRYLTAPDGAAAISAASTPRRNHSGMGASTRHTEVMGRDRLSRPGVVP